MIKAQPKLYTSDRQNIEILSSSSKTESSLLSSIFGGSVNLKSFLSNNFKKCPAVVLGSPERIDSIKRALFDLDVDSLLSNTASDSIQVWLGSKEVDKSRNPISSINVDPLQALKLYKAGHSLYCRAPVDFESMIIPKILDELGHGIKVTRKLLSKFTYYTI
jgi:hypothetical protein